MFSSKFWLITLVTLIACGAVPTVAVADDDAETCTKQLGDESIAACSRAIASDRYTGNNLAVLYARRAAAWSETRDYDRAIADFDEAIRLNPKYAHAYNHRGMTYFDKGDTDRAIADYDEAIRLNPNYAHAYANRGDAWSRKGDFARAIADHDEANRLNPINAACAPEAGRVIECIKPSATDPAIHRFDSPNYVLFNDNSGPDANLLVFLTGTNGRPPGPVRFLKAAADAGYRVISLAVNDVPAVAAFCPRRPDPDCSEKFRRMRIFGDGTTLDPAIDNTPAESIVNRLVKLLQYLDRREPHRGWGDYLENGAPKWGRIALAGQSQGAGMAAFIAQRHKVARVILFSSPWDFQVTGGHVRRLAPWISGPSKTPPDRWYGGYHEREKTAGLIAQAYAALRIPPDHIRVFQLDLPAQQHADSRNPFHGQGISNPAYDQDRAFFLGRSP